jgi:uncharacterized delta-60 repeat protein
MDRDALIDSKFSPPSRPARNPGERSLSDGAFGAIQDTWRRYYASGLAPAYDVATAMASDASGNVYVTGYSSNRFFEYFTAKYDAAGVQVWRARYNGAENGDDRAFAIAVDVSGNVYVTGESWGSDKHYDYATIKYSSTGEEQWEARYNGTGNSDDNAAAIAVDPAGNVYVTGSSVGSGPYSDYATIKYNAAGAEQWVACYNGPGDSDDHATALVVDPAGNVYVTGGSGPSFDLTDYATVKYNSAGKVLWAHRYNGPGNSSDKATAIALDSVGNVFVTGSSRGTGANDDYATIKYNSAGTEQWVARYYRSEYHNDRATALAVDLAGNVYVTGEWGRLRHNQIQFRRSATMGRPLQWGYFHCACGRPGWQCLRHRI